jgi:hypothetical protein
MRSWLFLFCPVAAALAADLQIAPFQADVTPPLGTPLCFGLVKPGAEVVDPLTARGIVIHGSGKPIVLTAVDWLGISNESHDRWRQALADAAGTTIDRVTVHVLHQHDAPGHDDAASRLLREQNLGADAAIQDDAFNAEAVRRVAAAVGAARRQRVTHVGIGRAKVEQVASNRRILGSDGKVRVTRMSSSRIPEAVAAPEGVIDPWLQSIGFWNGGKPVAVITYYATHPQSHYGKGGISWEFVGMARAMREKALPGAAHIHFNGAGGNVAAGKYNDGAPENRARLAQRLAAGMTAAWESMRKTRVSPRDVVWSHVSVALPLRADTHGADALRAVVRDAAAKPADRMRAARDLAFAERAAAGHRIQLSRLRFGPADSIYLPGELFIEYQLAAQQIRPVAVAAYGDLGPGYIGTEVAYSQGGYETGIVSRTAPSVEGILLGAIRGLLAK